MKWDLYSDEHGHYITIPKRINDKGDVVSCTLFTQKLSDAKLISNAPNLLKGLNSAVVRIHLLYKKLNHDPKNDIVLVELLTLLKEINNAK